jgi:hypothetical protein
MPLKIDLNSWQKNIQFRLVKRFSELKKNNSKLKKARSKLL